MAKHSLKAFDPKRVADLDTAMWRAYYAHNFVLLMELLVALFKEQFGVGKVVAVRLGYYSMQAARQFRKTGNMQRTEQYLIKYYQLLQQHAVEAFDPTEAAATELEWWVVHRYPARGSLAAALAANMAVLYSVAPAELSVYANERAEAMELRDSATHKDKREPDWMAIKAHLLKSYTALFQAVS